MVKNTRKRTWRKKPDKVKKIYFFWGKAETKFTEYPM